MMKNDQPEFKTLMDALLFHAEHRPDKIAFSYLEDGEDIEIPITFGELDRRVRAFAAHLQSISKAGARALLLYPTGLEFIIAYMGCLYAEVIAIPTTVPHLKRSSPRLLSMMKDAGAHIACTTQGIYEKVQFLAEEHEEFKNIQWVLSENVPENISEEWVKPESHPERIAFLQYTSGSTSVPKGVMISNFNLLRTIQDMQVGIKVDEKTTLVSWLPVFHDLGLIFGLLLPILSGAQSCILSPVSFSEKPFRWLRIVNKYKATHTVAPNFAYDLCTRKITEEEKSTLDLHHVTVAVTGAEPIRLETMQSFSAAFEVCGFNYNAFLPGYGLAEATIKVSGKEIGKPVVHCFLDANELEKNKAIVVAENDPNAYPIIGCGWSSINADIRIVNPATSSQCQSDEIGEIWVQSDSVAQGYWNNPEASKTTFQARIASTNEGPFLRTGDMGFILERELFITGRIKDMIIIQGRNYYPQDIELTMEKYHKALRPNCGAVFALDDGEVERLIAVQEVRREFRKSENLKEVADAIRMGIAKNHGLRAHAVVLIMPSTIHKTTSGKIQRSAVRESFLNKSLEVLYEWQAPVMATT